METSAVLALKRILEPLRKEQFAYIKLCSEILHCWLESTIVGCDNEEFAANMIERFKTGKYPFN